MTDITNQVSIAEILESHEERHSSEPVISPIAQFAVKTLKKYALQTSNLPRSTSDLSRFEEWLIIQLYEAQKERREEKMKPYTACANIGNIGLKKEITCPHCNKKAILVEKPIRIFNGSEYIEVQGLSYLCLCGSVFTTTESDTETMKRYYSFNSGKNIISPIDKI